MDNKRILERSAVSWLEVERKIFEGRFEKVFLGGREVQSGVAQHLRTIFNPVDPPSVMDF